MQQIIGVVIIFGSVFGGSGMAVGAGYLKRFEKSGSVNFLAGISINNSQMLETRVVAPALFRDRLQLGAEARWTDGLALPRPLPSPRPLLHTSQPYR